MKILACIVFGASALFLTACGSSSAAASVSSPSPTGGVAAAKVAPVDPCVLVTAGQASSAAGARVANLVNLGAVSPVPGLCQYGAQKGKPLVIVYVQVYPDAATANAVTTGQFQSALGSLLGQSSKDSKDVSEIGDRASEFTVTTKAGNGIAIVVVRSNVVFLVALTSKNDASTLEGLAKSAVAHLP